MGQISPLALLEAVARNVSAFGIRATSRRAPVAWREQSDPGRYAVVSHVAPWAAALRGDDRPIAEATLVQISIWETPAQAAESTDAGTLSALVDHLETVPTDLGIRARNLETLLVPEPDTDDVHTAITATYVAAR
jgi:hypothetical protein